MKASELMKMSIKELEALETELWKEWNLVNNVLKVVQEMGKEEDE